MAGQTIDGLIPAVVQDFHTGRVLMLAYVNQESYDYMLAYGETCFWSRSRQQLWHKGETSGNTQKIEHMAFDCDQDTLLIQVTQQGEGACHTGQYSCFGEESGPFYMPEKIFAQIQERATTPMENSYTNYLLMAGIDKVCKKIGEESAEVIIAAKNGQKEALTAEAADLLYHLLVLTYMSSVAPREVAGLLAKRHQVKGNLKPARGHV